jgi:hypothetical protein
MSGSNFGPVTDYRVLRGLPQSLKANPRTVPKTGARGSVVGLGTMLQTGRSRDQIPDEVNFFNLPNPSSRTMTLGSTQPLT